MGVETIHLNYQAEDAVIADFSPGVQQLLVDDVEFGFALKQTLKILNIAPEIPNPRQMILRGSIQDVATYTPWLHELQARELEIARASSFEQGGIYKPGRAPDTRDAVRDALGEVLGALPSTVATQGFLDICQVVIRPFAQIVLPPESDLEIVQGLVPPRPTIPPPRVQEEVLSSLLS